MAAGSEQEYSRISQAIIINPTAWKGKQPGPIENIDLAFIVLLKHKQIKES